MRARWMAFWVGLAFAGACAAQPPETPDEASANATMLVAQRFLQAAGSGDLTVLDQLMSDDFVWHNEGDPQVPWIGRWVGKEAVLSRFLPLFSAGLRATQWTTDYAFASGDQAVFMGTMAADAIATGQSTGAMTWAVRVHVVDGKVRSWNWLEDSFAVSQAFHGGG